MPALRANSGPVPAHQHHDVIQILHFAFDASHASGPMPAERPPRRAYVTVIKKLPHHPPLTASDVADAVEGSETPVGDVEGWSIGSCEVGECAEPRCVQVFYAMNPPANQDETHYDAVAPGVTAKLPRTWVWFLRRLIKLGRDDLRPKRQVISPEVYAAHPDYLALKAIITEKSGREGAFYEPRERFSVPTLALDMRQARRTLERRVLRFSGRTVLDLVQDIRLEAARELLPRCRTVREVAHRLGYSPQHFSSLFKARYGVNPRTLLMQ